MEDWVNLPLRGDSEAEICVGDDFFYLERACSFHLELLWSIHVKVGRFQPNLISYLPGDEFGGNSFLHFLLCHLVHSLCVISGSRKFGELSFQAR